MEAIKSFVNDNLNEIKDKHLYYGLSCILGAFLGDAMGSYCEFYPESESNSKKVWKDNHSLWNIRKGQFTDDSEMALSMAYGLCEGNNSFNLDRIAYFYKLWINSPPFDIGATTKAAICGKERVHKCLYTDKLSETLKDNTKNFNSESKSNGFLMRNTPMAVWIYYNFKAAFERDFKKKRPTVFEHTWKYISEEVSLTHFAHETNLGTYIYDFIIFAILRENSLSEKTDIVKCFGTVWQDLCTFLDHTEVKNFQFYENFSIFNKLFNEIKRRNFNSRSEGLDYLKSRYIGSSNPGYYVHAIILCFYFLKNVHLYAQSSNAYEEIIFLICNLGGDTDTNSAIVGGMIGAGFGFSEFPKKVNDMLNVVIENSEEFHDGRRSLYSPGFILFIIKEMLEKR